MSKKIEETEIKEVKSKKRRSTKKVENTKKVILSMTTMYSRTKMLEVNIHSLLEQTARFDKLIINIDDNLADFAYEYYDNLAKLDERIIVNKVDYIWKSYNKLIPTLKLYPDDIIITVDDDVYYPNKSIETLLNKHYENLDCIIAHEVSPVIISSDGGLIYLNINNVKLGQKEYGKYSTNCCLFPPHVFDNTDVFNYEKMVRYSFATNDSLWFWLQTTLKGVKTIGLNYVYSFANEIKVPYEEGQFKQSDNNRDFNSILNYMTCINKDYKQELIDIVTKEPIVFKISNDTVYSFLYSLETIFKLYHYGFRIEFSDDMTIDWKLLISNKINEHKTKNATSN